MTQVLQRYEVGEDVSPPIQLDRRRRRLSTIVKRHRLPGRRHIVSVHKPYTAYVATDETVRTRRQWKDTLVGPEDVVLITYLPLGGAAKGGSKGGKNIGASIAMLVLAIAVPFLVGAIAPAVGLGGVLGTTGALTIAGKLVAMGIVAGIGYLISKATKPKANKEDTRPVYGVTGGGNLPRKGDRIPVNYGRCWYQPDLSQQDYFTYKTTSDNDTDQILYKKMTLGAGKYQVHTIKVGDAVMWDEVTGLHAPFTSAEIEFITPGNTSSLVPSSVVSSDNVQGMDLGWADDANPWKGPYPVTDPGVVTSQIQLDYSWPQGTYQTHPKRTEKLPVYWGVIFEYCELDVDGNQISAFMPLFTDQGFSVQTRAVRRTQVVSVPSGRWAVRARNYSGKLYPYLEQAGVTMANTVYWDGLRGYLNTDPARPDVQEIAMKISAKAMGSTLTFSDIWVESTKILPVFRGGAWTEEPTRKAVWAYADIVRNATYGGAADVSRFDVATCQYYDSAITVGYDTFDGVIRGPVSVVEAAATVLGVIRAEPVLNGDVWTLTRDEPRAFTKHVVSRRQIRTDTTGIEFDLDVSNGESDVVGEYLVNGDPNRRAEVRETIGVQTITPRRINLFGVSTHEHAVHLSRWYAAVAYYRRQSRMFSTEMQGRLFQRNDPALIEAWFMDATQAAGVDGLNGLDLSFDAPVTIAGGERVVLRDEHGMEWGPVAVTTQVDPYTVTLYGPDVTTVESYTGKTLSGIVTGKPDRKLPVTAMIGQLQEFNRPYIIRSARYQSLDNVAIEAVYDAPEVWTVLGEAIQPGPPVLGWVDDSVKLPILPWVSAKVVQKATALLLEWAVGAAQGCQRYQVWMRYADRTQWEFISDGAALEGSYPVDFSRSINDPAVQIRARAVNPLGVPSQFVYATATLFAPALNNTLADLEVQIEDMAAQLRYQLGLIAGQGQGSLNELRQRIDNLIEQIAEQQATETGQSYEARNLIKVALDQRVDSAFAAIQSEESVRISEDSALAQRIDSLVVNIDDPNVGPQIQAAINTEAQARIDADTALSQITTDLEARINNTETGLNTEADLRQQLTTRVAADENTISAQAQDIEVLNTTVNGNSATLTVVSSSVDGIKVQYGVVGYINGQTGGFLLTGIRKLDGTVAYNVDIHGDFFVDGSITGRKISGTSLIISGNAQVGSLTIGNRNLQDYAATNAVASSGYNTASVSLAVRSGVRVTIQGMCLGGQQSQSVPMYLWRDTTLLTSVSVASHQTFDVNTGSPTGSVTDPTPIMAIDYPTEGTHTYQIQGPSGGLGTAYIIVTELAK